MTKEMRVAHAILGYFPQVGGAENQARLLIRRLNSAGMSITVFTRKYHNNILPVQDSKISIIRCWRAWGKGSKEIASIVIAANLLFKHHNYDLFHVHQCNILSFFVTIVGGVTGKPVIIKVANSGKRFDLATLRKRPFGWLMVNIIKRSSAHFVALSEPIAELFVKSGISRNRIHIIPNGVDVSKYPGRLSSNTSVGFVGRLEDVKRPEILLDMASYLPNMKFHIIGDGSKLPYLKNKAVELALLNVFFHGVVHDLDKIFDLLNVVVLPSLAEGMSNTLLEAATRAKRCLVTDLKENHAIFDDCKSIVNYVNSEKPIDWVEALTALLDVPDNLIFADQKVLIKRYNIKNIAHEYAKLYAESSGW